MIDRSYLPFQAAREYQDSGMQKWMGFFLSEHTTALVDDVASVTYLSDLSLEKKLLLLSQLYANQLTARLEVLTPKGKETYFGTILTISKSHIIIKTNQGHINVSLDDILGIELVEEVLDESA